jgi:hypothetical protein
MVGTEKFRKLDDDVSRHGGRWLVLPLHREELP